jgi:hypothetical protein
MTEASVWEKNVSIDLKEIVCGGVDCICLVQDRGRWLAVVSAVMNFVVK